LNKIANPMTFLYPILLSGVVLAGIPVILHLIMRQKPKHLLFPAFRFLLQQHRSNQRKLQLRHLLLLALRIFLIIGICLALARPKVFSERINLGGEQPIAAALVFDTSASMGYQSGGRNRLDEAKQRALELLDELATDSIVAVLDTAEPGGEWLTSSSQARERIGQLRLRPANGPVTGRLSEAYRLLADLDQETEGNNASLPRFIYVFSDRTEESWDAHRLHDLEQFRDRLGAPAHAVFVDVGTDEPVDLALVKFELPRQIVPTNDKLILRVTVSATGERCDTEVICRIDDEKAADHKAVQLEPGQSQSYTFERSGLKVGRHQAEVTLATTDGLAFNNALFVTFELRGPRQVLVLVDQIHDADFLKLALDAKRDLGCEVRTVSDVGSLSPADLSRYRAICLLNVNRPSPSLWSLLERYVKEGGGLAVALGEPLDPKAYNNDEAAQRLLPGALSQIVKNTDGASGQWKETSYPHPIMAPFREWEQNKNYDLVYFKPSANQYWEVQPYAGTGETIVSYNDKPGRPALLERRIPGARPGHVLLFTTPLDRRHLGDSSWNNYLTTTFYLAFVNKTLGYLAGDAEDGSFNYVSGQTPMVTLPPTPRFPTYTLQGPGLSPSDSIIKRADGQNELSVIQAQAPGNYTVLGGDNQAVASFSINVAGEESQLSRVPVEAIEELFGKGTVLAVGHGSKFHDVLAGHWNQPLELMPWLMVLVLFALAFENLLANKFYRRETDESGSETPSPAVEAAAQG
jgi:hypothetical protein